MGRAKHTTADELKMRNGGKSYQLIQNMLQCSARKVANAIKWQNKAENRGAKKKTIDREDRQILSLVKKDPFITSTKIVAELRLIAVSSSTVRRRWARDNMFARR
ncbi:hypothetical protein QE152_g1911 [Popillia japonica]|uniref:Transposase Tc1-like domain-containing protein n=1 Tax=Popillia japonica TaxID=7064 RepID=A0AAW1N572_POPJA